MAIFSQQSAQTATDFRVYDTVNRNRNIPYQLPKEIERQLKKLMTRLQLKEGSIDLIKTKDNKIVFLEVNPSGQFGMVSRPCNYHLEEKAKGYKKQLSTKFNDFKDAVEDVVDEVEEKLLSQEQKWQLTFLHPLC